MTTISFRPETYKSDSESEKPPVPPAPPSPVPFEDREEVNLNFYAILEGEY